MRKNIALVLALVMILSLVPMTAFAASTNSVDRVVTVGRDADLETDATPATPNLVIKDKDSSFGASTEVFRLTLGPDAEWNDSMEAFGDLLTSRILEVETVLLAENVFPMNVTLDGASGEQRVTIDPMDSPLTAGSYTFAIAAAGNTVVTVTKSTMRDRGTSLSPNIVGSIIIDETIRGTIDGEQELRLRLPRNFGWSELHEVLVGTTDPAGINFVGFEAIDAEVTISNSDRDMIVKFDAVPGDRRASIVVKPAIFAKRDASFGDVAVSLTGLRGDVDSASGLVIATYVDYGYDIESDTADDEFITGIVEDYTAEITIEETIANSLMRNRFVDVDLPSWVKIVNETSITVNGEEVAVADTDTSSFEFRLTPDLIALDADGDIVIEFEFTIAGNAAEAGPREMMVSIVGAGMDDEVSIGTAIPAISIEVVGEKVIAIGTQKQLVPEIWVTENFPGALREVSNGFTGFAAQDGWLTVTPGGLFPDSARFDGFSYEIVEGDIELGDKKDGASMQVEIKAESEEASVIRLYNIEMTLDRTVPMGGFRVDVGGAAVLDAFNVAHEDCPGRVVRIADYFEVGTPVVGEPDMDAAQVAFTVGQMAYMVDGEMMMMDVAPFIMNDRTMIPVRYLEELFGMQPVWNPTSRTVTVMYDGKVFEMAIGSNVLRVNGAPYMEMDAEAMIVNDRTFVPASRFARAMGIPYVWDATTQTATFN